MNKSRAYFGDMVILNLEHYMSHDLELEMPDIFEISKFNLPHIR